MDLALGGVIRLISLAGTARFVVVRPRWSGSAIGGGIGLIAALAGVALGVGMILSGVVQMRSGGAPAARPGAERQAQPPARPSGGSSSRSPTPVLPIARSIPAQDGPSGDATVTWSPPRISLGEPELSNPLRGAYRWYGQAPQPAGWPALDSYQRYTWRQLEPSRGEFNWPLIDAELAAAASRGGTFGLRIMAANSWDGGSAVPDYLMERMPKGFWFKYPGNGKSMYAPDWNDPDYLDRAEALIRALAQRYANDDRFGWIEIGPYGDFGEWHVWQWPYNRSPTGATDMTVANRQRLIDLHVELFPPNKLIQLIDSATGGDATMGYALDKSPLIGIRSDCFGTGQFDIRMREVAAVAPERWKTAPIVVEYCGGEAGSGKFAQGKAQISTHHVTLVEGNHDAYDRLSRQERRDFDETRQRAGYRFRLDSLTVPAAVDAGGALTITSTWANDGVAPAYADWDVLFQLRDQASGAIIWRGQSSLSLRSLLPTDPASPTTVAETFALGDDLSPGTYDLAVTVEDPGGYFQPLALAMQDRAPDGSYRLGPLTVR